MQTPFKIQNTTTTSEILFLCVPSQSIPIPIPGGCFDFFLFDYFFVPQNSIACSGTSQKWDHTVDTLLNLASFS